MHPGLKGAASFPHVLGGAFGTLDFIYYTTFLGVWCFVFRVDLGGLNSTPDEVTVPVTQASDLATLRL